LRVKVYFLLFGWLQSYKIILFYFFFSSLKICELFAWILRKFLSNSFLRKSFFEVYLKKKKMSKIFFSIISWKVSLILWRESKKKLLLLETEEQLIDSLQFFQMTKKLENLSTLWKNLQSQSKLISSKIPKKSKNIFSIYGEFPLRDFEPSQNIFLSIFEKLNLKKREEREREKKKRSFIISRFPKNRKNSRKIFSMKKKKFKERKKFWKISQRN